jgi:hypothetical protein
VPKNDDHVQSVLSMIRISDPLAHTRHPPNPPLQSYILPHRKDDQCTDIRQSELNLSRFAARATISL